MIGAGRKWERSGNGTAIASTPQLLLVGRASPGSGEQCAQGVVTKSGSVCSAGWGWGPRWPRARPVTPWRGQLPTSREHWAARLCSRRVWAFPAPGLATLGESPRSVCVTLLFFVFFSPSCVRFVSLELFHRNSGNKDLVFSWCSDVAGGVGWTLPPFAL